MKKKQNNKDVVTRQSDIHGKLTEWICPHGVGHHRGIHGCDGCCANESKMEQTTYEETTAHNDHVGKADDMVPPQSHIEEIWNLESDGDYWKIRKEQLPAYIKYLQSHAYRRAVEVIKETQKEFQNMPVTYDRGVDITEMPEGLGIEMTGMLKGLDVGFSQAIVAVESLSPDQSNKEV
jgi:hypothetical protein